MPIWVDIDATKRLLRGTLAGTVTGADFVAMRARAVADPDFNPRLNLLVIILPGSQLAMGRWEPRDLLRDTILAPGVRRAFVVPPDLREEFARFVKASADPPDRRVRTFDDVAAAERWLMVR